jgi:hypothetical protein
MIEAGLKRSRLVFVLPPAGERDQDDVGAMRLADDARGLVTVHARHPDVEQRDVRPKFIRQ